MKNKTCGRLLKSMYLLSQLLEAPVHIIFIQSGVLWWKGPMTHIHADRVSEVRKHLITAHTVSEAEKSPVGKTACSISQVVTLGSITPAARQQDEFSREAHQSWTTLSKHINTQVLTKRKKHRISPLQTFSGIQRRKHLFSSSDGWPGIL